VLPDAFNMRAPWVVADETANGETNIHKQVSQEGLFKKLAVCPWETSRPLSVSYRTGTPRVAVRCTTPCVTWRRHENRVEFLCLNPTYQRLDDLRIRQVLGLRT
jgi:hypothetical protein